MKVSELTGDKLDYWVAKAQGWDKSFNKLGLYAVWVTEYGDEPIHHYKPTTNWQQCGELIEKFNLNLLRLDDGWKSGYVYSYADKDVMFAKGSTPQEAICRAVVASIYGEEVSDD